MGKRRRILLGSTLALAAGSVIFLTSYKGTPGRTAGADRGTRGSAAAGKPDAGAGQFDTRAHELKMLQAALKKKPNHKPLLFRLAQLEEESGRKAEAEGYLRAILKTEPDDGDAQIELSKLLYERGDINGALVSTQHVLARQPDHPDALYNLGALYANLGNPAKARECWSRLIAAHPQSESASRARQMLPQLAASR